MYGQIACTKYVDHLRCFSTALLDGYDMDTATLPHVKHHEVTPRCSTGGNSDRGMQSRRGKGRGVCGADEVKAVACVEPTG